ncbi:nucleotide disphospho-sugar-binding domain-containing protein [Agrococcus carbonis]|uniref:Glycosyltransferase, MGT family n=1 Tax=Agrococcus carbonis TaxID=684552 RepID=A0A1H1N9M3_9MICO|nr:nucleotide disphospho-sugar-binding domain-containing protein [Agrococcus carbonis]SDR95664.1 glycosyltransferase, MGT family [Agrococcus carbonis]
MALIAAYTSPALAHAFPFAGVLLELQRRGHRIRLRTLPAEVDRMRQLGFDADAYDPAIDRIEFDDWRAASPRDALLRLAQLYCARGALDGPDLQAMLDDDRPDLVLTDINTWGAAAVAERSGLPWVVLSPYTPVVRSKGWPPFGPGLAPARGPLGRVRDALAARVVLQAATEIAMPRINALRAEVAGLPPERTFDDVLRRAPKTLVTSAEPLEYAHTDWEPHFTLVGPTTWEPPAAPAPWLDAIDGPVVLVTVSGDFQGDTDIARVALEALADEPVTVVATMPGDGRLGTGSPANAHITGFLPHGQVLEKAVCAITHGGMGVTQKALAHRVPVVVVPWGRDQFEVAARVEHAGAGVRVPRQQLTPERVRDAVRRARGMQAGVDAVAAGFEAAGGPPRAADLIEEQLRCATSP